MKQLYTRRTSFGVAMLGAVATALMAWPSGAQAAPLRGMVGVGTWATQAEFKDIKVTKAGRTLWKSNFSRGLQGWKTSRGKWVVANGVLRQTSNQVDARALVGDPKWSDYTLTLKARKIGGAEGFLVLFGAAGKPAKTWWNIGGWGNTLHGIEYPGVRSRPVKGRIATGRWYNIRVELKGQSVKCFLDNKLVQKA